MADEQRATTYPCRRKRSLGTGVAAADNDYIEVVREWHREFGLKGKGARL
jgi:hypothetical protein